MEKAGRGSDGAPRGPVLHIVVVGFHHKKGCQVRKGPDPAPRLSAASPPLPSVPLRSAQSPLQRSRPFASELDSSVQLLALSPPAAHPHTPVLLRPLQIVFRAAKELCGYVGVGRCLGYLVELEEGIEGRPHSLPGPFLSLLTLWVCTCITRAFRKFQHLDCVFKVMSSVGFHTNASGWLKHMPRGGKINFLCLSLEALESVALGWCVDSAPSFPLGLDLAI